MSVLIHQLPPSPWPLMWEERKSVLGKWWPICALQLGLVFLSGLQNHLFWTLVAIESHTSTQMYNGLDRQWTVLTPHLHRTVLTFKATLLSIGNVQMMSGATLADITSNLTVTATARLNTTVVQCRGTTTTGILTATNEVNVTSMFPNVLENKQPLS